MKFMNSPLREMRITMQRDAKGPVRTARYVCETCPTCNGHGTLLTKVWKEAPPKKVAPLGWAAAFWVAICGTGAAVLMLRLFGML